MGSVCTTSRSVSHKVATPLITGLTNGKRCQEVAACKKLKAETIHPSTPQSQNGEAYGKHPTSPEDRESPGFNVSTFLFRVELMSATKKLI